MSSVVAVVKSIIGQVIAVSPEGVQRVLVEGDRIYQGEQLITGASGAVTLDTGSGKLIDLGRDSQWSAADLPRPETAHAAVQASAAPSVGDLQKAIAAGLDPTQALAPTAAGPGAGGSAAGNGAIGGGHSFVMLNETAERVDPNIGYATAGLGNGGDAVDQRQGEQPANLAPAFADSNNGVLNLTTAEDTLLSGTFNARDPNGDTFSFSLGQGPANGQLVLNPNGTWQYLPNADYNGADSFTVVVTDGRGASSTLLVNVGITPVNDAPVATGSYTGTVTDTAANDSFADIKGQLTATDVDDTNLTWSGSSKGAYGELTVNADGSYTYVVDANAVNALPLGQNPTESFTVTVTDPSGATDTRVITINIQGANDTPVALDGQASGTEDSVIGGQLVATDRDTGSTLTFNTNGNPPAGFTLKPDGSWTLDAKDPAYQHLADGETLVVQVPYTVTDEQGATSTATLTVTLTGTNDAPVAFAGSATTEENTVLQGQVPVATDVDGTVVGYQLATGVGTGNGALTFNPDGSYSFNPGKDFDSLAQGETREVTFTYQAKDNNGALSDPQTITITVTGSNDAAVIGGQTSGSADETNAPVTIDGKLSISDVDSPASFQVQNGTAGTYGQFSVAADGSWTYVAHDAYNELKVGEQLTETFTVLAADGTSSSVTVTINGTNDAPVATDGSATTEENTVLQGRVPVATDVDGTVASYQLATDVAQGKGSLVFNTDGSYTFTPGTAFDHLADGQSETVTFTYQAKDNNGALSDPQTITITVTGSNDAAVIGGQTSGSADETNAPVTIDGKLSISDVDSPASFQVQNGTTGTYGQFSVAADGSWTYVAHDAYNELKVGEQLTETFTVLAADGTSSSVTVTINGTNDAPVATDGSATTEENTVLQGRVPVATDVDGTVVGYQLTTGVGTGNGALTFNPDGSYSFNPGKDFDSLAQGETREVTFTYQAKDNNGALSDPQTITITVTGSNDAAVIGGQTSGSADETNAPVTIDGKLSISDVDSPASFQVQNGTTGTYGQFSVAADGSWTYVAHDAYNELKVGEQLTETFTVLAADGTSSSVTVTINGTNDAPVATDGSATTEENTVLQGRVPVATDVDGTVASYQLATDVAQGKGSLVFNTDGSYTFTPGTAFDHLADGQSETVTFTYQAKDNNGALSDPQTITITVTGSNDAPVADATSAAVKEDAQIGGQLAATDADNGAKLTYSLDKSAPAGFSVGADGKWSFDASVSEYQHLKAGATQTLSIPFTVTDEHGATSSSSLTITITGTNDAPVANAASANASEDKLSFGKLTASDVDDGAKLSFSLNDKAPAGFALGKDGSWIFNGLDPAYQSLAAGESKVLSIDYTVTDEHGATSTNTLTLTVTGTNDTPVALPSLTFVREDTQISGELKAIDPDNGAQLTYTLNKTAPAGLTLGSDGQWSFDAGDAAYQHLKAGAVQIINVPYTVTDEHGASTQSVLVITVTGTNDAPKADAASAAVTEDAVSKGLLTATDVDDGAKLSFSVSGNPPAGFTLKSDGNWTFDGKNPAYQSLAEGETQEIQVKYIVTDEHGATDTQTLTLTVTGTNDAAVISGQTSGSADETDAPLTIDGKLSVTDVDSPASFQVQTNTAGDHGTFSIAADGTWSYVANSAYNELKVGDHLTDTFTVKAADGTSTTVTVTINGTNDKPVAFSDTQTTEENTVLQGQVPVATDVDGTIASYELATGLPQGKGSLVFNTDGSYTFTPGTAFDHLAAGASENVTFTYQAKDNNGAVSEPQTITITVTGTNDAAVISGQTSGSADESDAPLTIDGKLNVTDVDSPASFQVQANTAGDHGTFSIAADGTWSYVANSAYNELKVGEHLTDTFTVKAADGTSTTVTVTINGTNDKPVAFSDTQTTEENTVLQGQVPIATDIDGTVVRYEVIKDISQGKGTLAFNEDGSYTFTPGTAFDHLAAGASENVTFTYQAKDNNGAVSEPQTITITVTGTNDAAVISGQTSGSADESDAPLTIDGKLNVTDVDSPASFQVQTNTAGDHGTFSIAADGTWSYVANSAYNELKVGDHLTDTFTVKAADGTSTTVTVTINGTNDKPVAFSDTQTTEENTVLQGQVPVATDVDGTIASYELATGLAQGKGSLVFNTDGSYTFNPGTAFDHLAAGASENVTFTYQAKDNNGALSDPQTVTITVTGTNDKPVAFADAQTTEENTVLDGQVPVATDVDGTIAGYQLATDVAQGKGSLTFNANGSYTFNPGTAFDHLAAGASENVTFTYQAKDNNGALSDPQTVTITVTGTNDKPVAFADAQTTEENTVLHGQVPVATDVDGTIAGYQLATDVAQGKGSLTFNTDGSYTFTPGTAFDHLATGASENVTFTYQAKDNNGALSDPQTITITVTGTNDAAVITGQTSGSANETDAPITLGGKLDVTDVDGPASFQAQSNVAGLHGTFNLGTDGTWTYTANSAYNELKVGDHLTDTFAVKAADGTSTTVTVTINGTNDAPVASADVASTEENSVLNGQVPAATDVDGTVVSYQLSTDVAPGKGSLTFNANGSYTFNPGTAFDHLAAGASENVTFTYQAKDNNGALSDPQTVTITVTGTNDKPVAFADAQTTEENTVLDGQVPAATDVDGTVVSYQLTTDVAQGKGSLTFNADGSYTFNPGTAFDHLAQGQSENVTFTYQAKDNNGALSDPQTVTITVTGTNDAPVAVPDTAHTNEDTAIRIDVLSNDTDAEHDALIVTGASAGNGTVVINQDGSLSYTPKENFSGSDTITYTISDGKGGTSTSTVAVSIEAVADKPNLSLDGSSSHPKATGLTVDTWTGLALGNGGNGASPADLQAKIDAAGTPTTHGSTDSVRNTDVTAGTATKVSGLIFLEAGHTYTFSGVGDDSVRLVIGGSTVAQATWGGTGGTSGQFSGTFTPTESGYYPIALYQHNQSGPGNYTLSISDNGSAAQVLGTGSAQVFHDTGELTTGGERLSDLTGSTGQSHYKVFGVNEGNEDSAISLSKINASLVDTDGSETLAISIGKIPAGATLSDGKNSFTADATHDSVNLKGWNLDTLTLTPPADFNGTIKLEVSATATESSNNDAATRTVDLNVTVYPVNDVPTSANQNQSTAEDTPLSGKIVASDVDGDTLSYAVKTGATPAHGSVTVNAATGDYTYTPAKDYNGSDSFTVRVSDGKGGFVDSVVNIDVTPVNDAPTSADQSKTTPEDTALTGKIVASDVDGDTLSYAIQAGAAHGTLVLNVVTGDYTYTPSKDYNGSDSFTVRVSDGKGDFVDSVVSIDITPVNDVPTSVNQNQSTAEDTPLSGKIVASDVDGDTLSYAVKTGATPAHGSVTVNAATGDYTYTPAKDYNGSDSFTVRVSDGKGGFVDSVVNIDVTPVNDAPEAKSDNKSTGENTALSSQVPVASDVDSAINPNGYALVQGVGSGNGSLTFNANGSYVFNPGSDFDSLAPGESRQVTFTYTAKDAEGAVSAPATVTITVNGANDAPNGADKTISLDEDSSRSFAANDFGFTDVDHNDALSAVRIDSLPTNGSLKFNGSAVTAGQVIDVADLGKLVFTPSANANGNNYANFTFSVKDSNGAFDTTPNKLTFNVTAVNDNPVAVNDSFSLSGLKGNYWGYNEGTDGANLTTLSQVTTFMNGHAASATFTSSTLNYNLSGGDLGGDGNLQKFLGNDAATLNTDPANTSDAIIQLTGLISLNAGSYQFRVNADDGFVIRIDGKEVFKYDGNQSPTGRESAVFNITESGNHQIEIIYWDQGGQAQLQVEMRPQGGTYSVLGGTALTHTVGELVTNEDTPLTITPQTLLGNDSDVDGDPLSIISVQGAVNGSVKLEGGNVVFSPNKDFNGAGSFTYTISDGHGGTSTATVTVGVNAVNDAPEAKSDSKTTGENTAISGQVPSATDVDSAVDANGYALVSGPSAGTLTFNANGSYVYNPGTAFDSLNAGETRQVTFTYTAKDVQGAVSAPATVTITINGENDAPTGADKTVSLNEDGSRTFTAADFGFADKDAGDALQAIRIDNLPTAGSLTLNGQSVTAGQVIAVSLLASLVYTPLANAAGAAYATLKFSVQDSHDSFSSASNTLTFTVNAVNDAPLSADGSASVYAGKTYTFGLKDFAFSDTTDSANGQNHGLQNVIVKALPDSGSLLLNGTAVKAGQAISASDIAGGKLTFVPDSAGANAHFSFAVQDSGGVANGGVDTSPTYGFDIHVGQVQIPGTTPNGDNTLTGGSGDDVILGDVGGVKTLTQGGTNYNIALVIDTSGSMAYNLAGQSGAAYADSRMKLVKDALINLANELKGHDGVVNIALIGFQSTASLKVSVSDLTSANIDKLVTAINGLSATGGTDYQAAFEQAVSWFNGQTKGYTNLTLFLTDGDPTESKSYGDGSSTSNNIVKESAQAFVALSDLSEVRAIGIGTNVNSDILKHFDNSNVTGLDTSIVLSTSNATLFTFNNGTTLTGWTLAKSSTGSVGISANKLSMTDTHADGASTATSSDLTVAKNSMSTFSFDFAESMSRGDTFTYSLEKLVNGVWTSVESKTLTSTSSNTTYTTGAVGEGTYHLNFVLTDTTNNSSTASATIDNIKQATTNYAPTGEVDIVKQASDLTAALHGGSTSTELAPSGSDTIHGGAGDDIVFGDTINTDNLPWGVNGNPAKPADMPAGSGVSALSAFLELKNGHAATSDEMYNYIKDNHALFNVDGDTRGGSDHLYGGDGNDILYGQGGNDFLFGENGNDILLGGTGDDQLTGGQGNDILTGGAGADLFIWKAGDTGNDIITDFKVSEGDRIDLSDLLPDAAHNDILSYLKVDTATSTLQVSTTGQVNSSADVTIKLTGVDLSTYGSTSSEIVNKLVAGADPVVKTEHH